MTNRVKKQIPEKYESTLNNTDNNFMNHSNVRNISMKDNFLSGTGKITGVSKYNQRMLKSYRYIKPNK